MRRAYIRTGVRSPIRVSLPGYDVEQATLPQLSFDAASRCYYPFMSGIVDADSPGSTTVFYPETLLNPPFCRFHVSGGSGRYWARDGQPTLEVKAEVRLSEVEFSIWFGAGDTVPLTYMLIRI